MIRAESDALKAAQRVHAACGGGTGNGRWAGVTNDAPKRFTSEPPRRLLEHSVDPRGTYAFVECTSEAVSREAKSILQSWGYAGKAGDSVPPQGGAVFVYAYVITPETRQET